MKKSSDRMLTWSPMSSTDSNKTTVAIFEILVTLLGSLHRRLAQTLTNSCLKVSLRSAEASVAATVVRNRISISRKSCLISSPTFKDFEASFQFSNASLSRRVRAHHSIRSAGSSAVSRILRISAFQRCLTCLTTFLEKSMAAFICGASTLPTLLPANVVTNPVVSLDACSKQYDKKYGRPIFLEPGVAGAEAYSWRRILNSSRWYISISGTLFSSKSLIASWKSPVSSLCISDTVFNTSIKLASMPVWFVMFLMLSVRLSALPFPIIVFVSAVSLQKFSTADNFLNFFSSRK